MIKQFILFFSVIIFLNSYSQTFFDQDQIQVLELTFQNNDWDTTLDAYKTAGPSFRLIAQLSINGEVFDSVGVRYKGNSSYDATRKKNPFNIKLDHIKGKQNIEERNVLKLSNVFRDPSFVREVLSYEIARKYMPSSASNYAKLFVNGTYIGLYVNDESTNLAFAARHYFKSNNPYFEGTFTPGTAPIGCPQGAPQVMGYLGTDTNCYKQYYLLESNNHNDWFQLVAALDTFNNYPNFIENAVYIDRLLWMLAFNNVLVNLDAPINTPHNFLLYKDGTDRFNPILWDLNESFGSFNMVTGPGGASLTNTELQQLSPWFNATSPNHPIMTKTFADDRNKKKYIAKMKTIFEENINNDWYEQRANELQTTITTAVNDDLNKFYPTGFSQNITSTVSGRIGLTELMIGRKTFLNSQADFIKAAPVVSDITSSPTIVTSNSTVIITADITNATYAYLGYRFSPKEKFQKIQMTNTGNEFSATISVEHADIHYYIWAENADAGIFSPERAEYEFHRIGVSADVVINELQSRNKATQFDEAVEYDDWVELYNNTDQDIDLTGWYLSDNKDTLTKWAIPSQTIPADDYIIFWTDKDIIQGANHTNFQLTKNGESLYLVNPSEEIVNKVTYPHMEIDKSYSRYFNGTGAFVIKEPTFKATNGDTILPIVEIDEMKFDVEIYPNPANNILNLYSSSNQIVNTDIKVFDITGKELLSKKWNNTQFMKLNISTLSSGIYFIELDNNISFKFVNK